MEKLELLNKMLDAGFTANEIKVMLGASQPEAPAEPEAAPAEPEAAPEVPAEAAPAVDPFAEVNKRIDALMGSIEKIAKTGLMPTLDNVEPKGIDDVIVRFFKED